jgi:hypothetical protein
MNPNHYDMLNHKMTAYLDAHPEIDVKQALASMRARWDIYWKSGGAFSNAQEYQYLTDNHIDTALKSILEHRVARKGPLYPHVTKGQQDRSPGGSRLYHRGPDGYPVNSDKLQRDSWGKIPIENQEFQSGRGYEKPAKLYGWSWSPTFNRWSAFIRFADGKETWTYPRTTDTSPIKLPMGIEDVVIQDTSTGHKLVKIYRNGRVFATHYAEPFPTKESAITDYVNNPKKFDPYDESAGTYMMGNYRYNPNAPSSHKDRPMQW